MAIDKTLKQAIQEAGKSEQEQCCIFDRLIEQSHGRKGGQGKLDSNSFKLKIRMKTLWHLKR